MKKSMSPADRAMQIELVRARAALERQSLGRNVGELTHSFTPSALMSSFFPRMSSRKPSDWLFKALSLGRQYPLLASVASTAFSRVGKRRRLWRIAAGLLLSWQVARAMKR